MWQKRYKGAKWVEVESGVVLSGLNAAYEDVVVLMEDMKAKGYAVDTNYAQYRWQEASDDN